jgi:diadenosine tetraphosphatase ApaH/serine/threonine PP2A family protein phosphatase
VDDKLVLFCHASPGSLTDGLPADLDPVVTIERVSGTDASVIVCGHTHIPEVREIGWRTIVNDGSAGYVFDGDPTASWALIEIEGGRVSAEIQRVSYDVMAAANSVSARGLPGDVYRAATIRTGKLVR